jgi:hypothetical protein
MPTTEFAGEIRVAARIIDYLSSGLYPSAAACLKELINNSYDADASNVDVFVKPDADQIIIVDNGTGFTRVEFERHFQNLAESHKRDETEKTRRGRPKIGKIGIGFIAANELCEEMEIFSTTKDSKELLHVRIDFSEMRKPIEERRRDDDKIAKADYQGEVLETNSDEHYTQLFLKNIRGPARDMLVSAKRQQISGNPRSLYGLTPESVSLRLRDPSLKSWDEFDFYSQNMLKVALNVPVRYLDNWMPEAARDGADDFTSAAAKLKFNVRYDGAELRKPILFRDDKPFFLQTFKYNGTSVSATGYFFARHGTIEPHELQGLLVRIRNSAVGEYDRSFWNFSQTEFPLIQRWISCEIWASDQLEEAMNIDRATLRETHETYVELRDAIHAELRKVLARARTDIYEAESNKRKVQRGVVAKRELRRLADDVIQGVAPKAASDLKRYLTSSRKNTIDPLRKLSISEVYELFVEISKDILPKAMLERFLKALNERLGGPDA